MNTLPDKGYAELLERVQGQILAGRERVRQLVEQETVRLYWELGGTLGEFLESVDKTYGRNVVKRLSEDIQISGQILYDAVKFRTLFPIFPTWGKLSWSHYRRVLPVYTEGARAFYLQSAAENGWSVRELTEQIKDDAFHRYLEIPMDERSIELATNPPRLNAKRGDLHIYRVKEKWGKKVLDLGFRSSEPLPDDFDFEVGTIVRSVPDARYASGYRIEPVDLRRRIYAYRATVERIIDGDTLWATIDFGFDRWIDVKLRLRGIDADETGTPGGLRATDFLTNVLSEAGDFVVTTTKVDLYDRYLADLFVLPGETDFAVVAGKGTFVNRSLLHEGLARLWTDEKPPEF